MFVLYFLISIAAIVITIVASYFVARAVEKKLTAKKKWVRLLLTVLVLLVSFAGIGFAQIMVIKYTVPNEGFSR